MPTAWFPLVLARIQDNILNMDKRLFNDFLRFLASNLDYIFIAIGSLLVLLFVVSLFPSRKKKKIKLQDVPDADKVKKQIDQASLQVGELMAAYESRIAHYEQEEESRKERIQGLENAIAERDDALRNLEGAPEELQQVLASIDASGNVRPKRKGRFGAFLLGLILGAAVAAGSMYAYQNWNDVQQYIPAALKGE